MHDKTMIFSITDNRDDSIRTILTSVYQALEEKGYNPLAYRFFALQSHYRKPLTFSYEALDQAEATYKKLKNKIATIKEEGAVDEKIVKE